MTVIANCLYIKNLLWLWYHRFTILYISGSVQS